LSWTPMHDRVITSPSTSRMRSYASPPVARHKPERWLPTVYFRIAAVSRLTLVTNCLHPCTHFPSACSADGDP
jgi:hypothetical protein